jgi:hypothetical protein
MADSLGLLSKMAIVAGSSWDQAYQVPSVRVPFSNESITPQFSRIDDDSIMGSGGRNESMQGVEGVVGTTNHILDYNNFDLLMESFFGAVSTRTFTLSDGHLDKWLHLSIYKQVSNWRLYAAKLSKLVISGEKDGYIMAAFDWVVRTVVYQAEAAPAASLVGLRTKIRFEDLTLWLGTVAGGAMGAGDNMRLDSFELSLDRGLVPDDYGSKSQVAGEEKLALEPVPNALREVALKLKVPRYATDADLIAWKAADSTLQAKMSFAMGGETMVLDLPHMKINEGFSANVGGPERAQLEGGLACFMPESTNPLYTGGECRLVFS